MREMSLFRPREQSHETPDNQEEGADTKMQEAGRSHVEELTAAFQESWEKNHKEGDPKVSFKIALSAHVVAEDVSPNMRSDLEKADIYMTELVGWDPQYMKTWNAISDGKEDPAGELGEHPRHREALQEALHGTGVLVMSPDVQWHHTLVDEIEAQRKEFAEIVLLPFDEAIPKYDAFTRANAVDNREREKEIMKNIPSLIREALENNEELREKESINVYMTYGSMHTALYHALSATDNSASREMLLKPNFMYPHGIELERKYIFGVGGNEPNPDLAARALVECVIASIAEWQLAAFGANTSEMGHFIRMAVERLSPEDLSEIWDVHLDTFDTPAWPPAIIAVLRKNGISVPETKGELDEYLHSKRK